MMGTLSTVYLELVFYADIKKVHQSRAIHDDVAASYPILPWLGPSTVIIVDMFDLQGRSREGLAWNGGRYWPIVIVNCLFIDSWSPGRATRALYKRRKVMHWQVVLKQGEDGATDVSYVPIYITSRPRVCCIRISSSFPDSVRFGYRVSQY